MKKLFYLLLFGFIFCGCSPLLAQPVSHMPKYSGAFKKTDSIYVLQNKTLHCLTGDSLLQFCQRYLDFSGGSDTPIIAGSNVTITRNVAGNTISATGGSTSPGGFNNDIQFNIGGLFGGSNAFTWDSVNHFFGINGYGSGIGTSYGTMQAGITGTTSETGMYFNNTGTGGVNANIFTTANSSDLGGGHMVFGDITNSRSLMDFDITNSVFTVFPSDNDARLTLDHTNRTLDWNSNDSYFNLNGNTRLFQFGDWTYDWYGTSVIANDDPSIQDILLRANNGVIVSNLTQGFLGARASGLLVDTTFSGGTVTLPNTLLATGNASNVLSYNQNFKADSAGGKFSVLWNNGTEGISCDTTTDDFWFGDKNTSYIDCDPPTHQVTINSVGGLVVNTSGVALNENTGIDGTLTISPLGTGSLTIAGIGGAGLFQNLSVGNGLSISGDSLISSGGGTPSLHYNYIGFGNSSNLLSGSDNFVKNRQGFNVQDSSAYANIFIGSPNGGDAGDTTTTGYLNTMIGYNSGVLLTSGNSNVGVGAQTLGSLQSGINNTALGFQSGETNVTGGGLTFLGANADVNADGYVSSTAIGQSAIITMNYQLVFGTPTEFNWEIVGNNYTMPNAYGKQYTALVDTTGSGNTTWKSVPVIVAYNDTAATFDSLVVAGAYQVPSSGTSHNYIYSAYFTPNSTTPALLKLYYTDGLGNYQHIIFSYPGTPTLVANTQYSFTPGEINVQSGSTIRITIGGVLNSNAAAGGTLTFLR